MKCLRKLPRPITTLPKLAASHRFAARDVVIVELSIFHGLGSTVIPKLNCRDIDFERMVLSRPGASDVVNIRTSHPALWHELVCGQPPAAPLIRSKSGARMSRVDIWRILRRVGEQAGLDQPMNSRRARHYLGKALGASAGDDVWRVALELGVRDLRSVGGYFRKVG